MKKSYDYIVIGGGSSGCVVAGRLANESNAKILLLEAGHFHHHPLLDMPPGIFKMINGSKFMKFHHTVPQDHLDGRIHDIPQGNVLGGGSSVNAQVYMRGRPTDYDEWDEILRINNDRIGWGWNDVLPHFKRMENNNRLNNDFHGVDGPVMVSDPGYIDQVSRWFVQTVQALGENFNVDFNGETQRGVGFYQFTNRSGKRSSAAYAYIEPQLKNENLTIRLHSEVQRLILENGIAKGVEFKDRNGNIQTVHCDGEIILSSGALITPKLLMLSGIGPPDQLAEHGIECKVSLPGVGQNLIDHPEVPMTALVNGPYGYYKQGKGLRMLKHGLQFKLFGSGPINSSGFEAGAFVNPSSPNDPPTIQAFCVPIVYLDRDAAGIIEDDYGITITTVLVKPRSRGFVRLASDDPAQMPLVSPNLLKDKQDMENMIAGQRYFLRVFGQKPMSDRIRQIVNPPSGDNSDETLTAHCKRHVKTNYHPAGTARMGADNDSMAVLDARLRVRGVEKLRVCDMSAVPNINAGNTNAPAMMLGDRCTDLILEN